MDRQTEQVQGLYTHLQRSTSVYNTIQQEEERVLFQNKSKKHTLCVFYCTYLHTHKHTEGRKSRSGPCCGLWVITGDTIWDSYSGEKASKPTQSIKSLLPWHAFISRLDQTSPSRLFPGWRMLINGGVSCIQCWSFYSDSCASKWSDKSSDAVWYDDLLLAPLLLYPLFFRKELKQLRGQRCWSECDESQAKDVLQF